MRNLFSESIGIILCCLMPMAGGDARAQSEVTFNLDLEPLIRKQLFISARGDRVFVRGEFNQWSGSSHELYGKQEGGFYSGTFAIDATPGDTLEYKFVIARMGDRIFWEHIPEPANGAYGNRRLVISSDKQTLPLASFMYDEYFQYPVVFDQRKLQADFDTIRAMLERIHPALYDYTPKEILDTEFERVANRLIRPLEFRDYYTLLSRLVAKIGCGHTSLWIQSDYWNTVPDSLFPLRLHLDDNGVFINGSYLGEGGIPEGSRLLSINGIALEEVIDQLQAITSADGFNRAYKKAMVQKNFSKKYALVYGFPGQFRLSVIEPGSNQPRLYSIAGVSSREIDRQAATSNKLEFRIMDDSRTGLLTINTFGYYNRVDMFRSFIDSVFREVKEHGIENLILDLRGNSGGDPFCASYLFSYLAQHPVPYFEDHYGQYDTLALPVPLAANHYKGELFTLTDGRGFSTTGHFCALLKYHKIGRFVGSETGATYTCTGSVTYPTLEQTRIILGTARNRRYTAAVENMDPTRGIVPDYPVSPNQDDIIRGRDAVLEFALSLAEDRKGDIYE